MTILAQNSTSDKKTGTCQEAANISKPLEYNEAQSLRNQIK